MKGKQNIGEFPASESWPYSDRIKFTIFELSKHLLSGWVHSSSIPTSETSSEPIGNSASKNTLKNPVPWIVGIGMLIFITVLLVFFSPCPTESQFFAFRLILALAAAILANQLPGMFYFELTPFLKASGTLAIFGAIFYMNPAKLVGSERCSSAPFEFTVQIRVNPGLSVPSNYPKLENATLEIWLDNYWKPNDALNNGVADFKTIPSEKRDQKIPVQLQARYWKLSSDSVALIGKSQIIFIEPDGSLAEIVGKVMDSKTGNPVEGALVEASQISKTTGSDGNFRIIIPLENQRDEYEVYITKTGYITWKGSATPATGVPLSVIFTKD